ncbi:MAG: cytochrome C [Thermodesulfovibrionales bacterium]
MKKKALRFLLGMLSSIVIISYPSFAETSPQGKASVSQGRYLAKIAGCNDCHTKGWMATEGKVPESDWLTGDVTGWSGPWGTTYAPNLRLFMQGLSENAWVGFARKMKARPPMPWWALHEMKEKDLRSIYRFVKSLGSPGQSAPTSLPPGQQPHPPYFMFVPPSP